MTRLPAGWVKRWPSGYLGPKGETVVKLGRFWMGYRPNRYTEHATTLGELLGTLGYGQAPAADSNPQPRTLWPSENPAIRSSTGDTSQGSGRTEGGAA